MARSTSSDETAKPRKGLSLAKGPVAIIGIASLALGILGFILANQSFSMDAPGGTVNGGTFLGIEGNGWTWALFAAAGLLLLLGSPMHWGAKTMALIVGVAMIVGALIALADGTDILGIFATNNWTKLIMGAMGVALVVLAMLPRVGKRRGGAPRATRDESEGERRFDRDRDFEPVATSQRTTRTTTEPVTTTRVTTEPVDDGRGAGRNTVDDGRSEGGTSAYEDRR